MNFFLQKMIFLFFTASVESWKPGPTLVPGVFTVYVLHVTCLDVCQCYLEMQFRPWASKDLS